MPLGGKVRADLMGFPRDQPDFQQSNMIPGTQRPVLCFDLRRAGRICLRKPDPVCTAVLDDVSLFLPRQSAVFLLIFLRFQMSCRQSGNRIRRNM